MRIPRTLNEHTVRQPVNSSASFVVRAAGYVSVRLHIGRRDGGFYAGIAGMYSPESNDWDFYVPPYFFPHGCKTGYKVVGEDEHNNRAVVATGRMFVVHGVIEDDNDNPTGSAEGETFIRCGDGWHRMRVATNDVGRLTFTVEQKAAPTEDYNGDTGYDPKAGYVFDQPYAFNPDTGKFHPVMAFRDEVGEVMAKMDDAVDAGHESFALDTSTHLFHRVDTNGNTLVVGEAT